jgi:hypothetical protein
VYFNNLAPKQNYVQPKGRMENQILKPLYNILVVEFEYYLVVIVVTRG